jgi:hypothetical protein
VLYIPENLEPKDAKIYISCRGEETAEYCNAENALCTDHIMYT